METGKGLEQSWGLDYTSVFKHPHRNNRNDQSESGEN